MGGKFDNKINNKPVVAETATAESIPASKDINYEAIITALIDKIGPQKTMSEKTLATKYNGRKIVDNATTNPPTLFLSTKKYMILFLDDNEMICFKDRCYETNDPEHIEFLRSSPLFNIDIFEGKFSADISKKLAKNKEGLTYNELEYDRGLIV